MSLEAARARRDVVRKLLAPPRLVTSHMPANVRGAAQVSPRSDFMPDQRNLSKPWRMLAATVRRDLFGEPLTRISEYLGRSDHLAVVAHRPKLAGACDGARKDTALGRRWLHAIGAWPWAHAEEGRLPRQWWTLPQFTGPLRSWYASAYRLAYANLMLSADAAGR
jgi:hypothetical protein